MSLIAEAVQAAFWVTMVTMGSLSLPLSGEHKEKSLKPEQGAVNRAGTASSSFSAGGLGRAEGRVPGVDTDMS